MTKPKPHRKRLEMEILLDDIHQLEKNGKITTSTALQPTLLAEAAKTRGVYHSKLLNMPIPAHLSAPLIPSPPQPLPSPTTLPAPPTPPPPPILPTPAFHDLPDPSAHTQAAPTPPVTPSHDLFIVTRPHSQPLTPATSRAHA
ncbi:hypothetical protein Pcinc_000133 [Petrolisthes cinctipes]|uniref:Uncharacterized protein n=1 Tax=Petrolisthes cinctipes TaxID=88211 RepID=A0AAE1L4P3_PETCI|nr:hypothetical protein Pcinc_000133 [Petrolisthes cinctipes]